MISVRNIDVFYGRVHVLKDVSIEVGDGELVAVIGSNGAGKTTLIKAISGQLHPAAGQIMFDGNRIDHLAPYKIASIGLIQVPEGKGIFPDLSVMENLKMGAYPLGNQKQRIRTCFEQVFQLFPILAQREKQRASSLSGGEQQMLAIGRGLMADATMLFIDEPSVGLAPMVIGEIFNVIQQINREGKTVLLVEQNVAHALAIAQRAYVLEQGRVVLAGESGELLNSDDIRRAYLGGG